jgi:hypothetical protein
MQCDQALLVEGDWRCDDFMKLRASSSGCAIRPVKGEPARAGRKPGADARNGVVSDAEAGERAGRGTAAPKPLLPGGRERWIASQGTTTPV